MNKPITNGQTLKGMERAGFIQRMLPFRYVDEGRALNGAHRFTYKGRAYKLQYVDGCFYPYVVPAPAMGIDLNSPAFDIIEDTLTPELEH